MVPWRRRTIRRLLPRDESPSPEAVHLAASLRDQAREAIPPSRWVAPVLFIGACGALAAAVGTVPAAARGPSLWAAVCGAVAGAAAAAFLLWFRGPR